jgi:protein-tyrosine phosphatase
LIDIHCHILPGIDDGAASVEESVEMAKQAVSDGIRITAATPHTLNGVYLNPLSEITRHVSILREILADQNIPLELFLGSDAHIVRDMAERVDSGDAVTLNDNGKYLLVEFPPHFIPEWHKDVLFQLRIQGITPIITHPERNIVLMEHREMLYDLVSAGCLMQITAMSITGEFGEYALDCARFILEHRLAHIIATDAHSSETRRPKLSSAVKAAARILGDLSDAEKMVTDTPNAVISGESVIVPQPEHSRPKKWSFLKFRKTRNR